MDTLIDDSDPPGQEKSILERRSAAILATDVVGYVTFQMAEVAVSKSLFKQVSDLIDDLRRRPVPT